MRVVFAGLLVLAMGACAPAPARVPVAQAGELLEQFAAGSSAAANVCTAEGRAVLRGAVRAYGAEMNANGVRWPTAPGAVDAEPLRAVDANVAIAFAAGFIDVSDFRGPARHLVSQFSFAQFPEIGRMREATQVACAEVVNLQQAAAHVVMETERLRQMTMVSRHGARAAEHLRRQQERVERAEVQMQTFAAEVRARLEAARRA